MNRRDFLKDAATLSMTAALAAKAIELQAQTPARVEEKPKGPPVTCAVIGINSQGRAMLTAMAKMGAAAPVAYICDTFTAPTHVKKSTEIAPSAKFVDDYRKVLDDKSVQAVFVATPSHKHKQIVLDALQAGKHVYCEAPLATDLAEAKEIAKAGLAAKTIFMPGLQVRSNAQHHHVRKFVQSGTLGNVAQARAQYHNRQSWKQDHPDDARMRDLNWRLSKATSSGLLGEVGIHQIDTATWFLNALPVSVTAFGSIMAWKDGRDVADTVQCVVEYPKNIRLLYDATLASAFDDAYELFFGTSSTIQLRDQRAWMFKESDANDLGWETFARKDDMIIGNPKAGSGYKSATGVALVADASKQLALGLQPGALGTDVSKTALYQAIDAFRGAINQLAKPTVTALEGYQATVIAHKCNEAALTGGKITFEPEWFQI